MTARLLCLMAIVAMAVGCSPSPVAQPTVAPQPVVQTKASATPLAVEQKPTPRTGTFYQPPGWDGVSDVNCKDFDTHAHAMSFFTGTGGSTTNDPYGMDGDHDGNACETLP
jgi:hypothetical protein